MPIPPSNPPIPEDKRLPSGQRDFILSVLAPYRPEAVYLFGSGGTDRQHPGSDLDIAVLPGMTVDPVELFETANQIANHLNKDVDLLDLSRVSPVIGKEVLRTGLLLAGAESTPRQEFEMRILSDYARLNEERQPVLLSS